MTTVLLIIQIMISIVLIGLILIQKSEGGALGIGGGGGGGGGGGLMSGRSSASAVVKATAILGTLFIVNCLALSIFFALENQGSAFSGENPDKALITQQDSPKGTIPLADETVEVPAAAITPPEDDATPSQDEQ